MENIDIKVKGNELIITIDLSYCGQASASGKTNRIASTLGNQEVVGRPGVFLGINCYSYAKTLPCPKCGEPARLTQRDRRKGYHCDECLQKTGADQTHVNPAPKVQLDELGYGWRLARTVTR